MNSYSYAALAFLNENDTKKQGNTRVGFLSVDDEYDGRDNFCGTTVETYSDAPWLGTYENVIEFLRQFDGKRVRLTVEEL